MKREIAARLAVAAAVVAVAAACGGTGHGSARPRDIGHVRATVMFVGDSNITFALTALGLVLTSGDEPYQIVDVARGGVGIRFTDCTATAPSCATNDFWKVRLAEALKHVSPDGFVVDLGINDTVAPGTPTSQGYAAYQAKVDWLMQLLPRSKPVWWTNLPCEIEPKERATGCTAVNAALEAAPRRWRNLTVLDWAAAADGKPAFLLANLGGVHLSDAGSRAWANRVAHALNARFPP